MNYAGMACSSYRCRWMAGKSWSEEIPKNVFVHSSICGGVLFSLAPGCSKKLRGIAHRLPLLVTSTAILVFFLWHIFKFPSPSLILLDRQVKAGFWLCITFLKSGDSGTLLPIGIGERTNLNLRLAESPSQCLNIKIMAASLSSLSRIPKRRRAVLGANETGSIS